MLTVQCVALKIGTSRDKAGGQGRWAVTGHGKIKEQKQWVPSRKVMRHDS